MIKCGCKQPLGFRDNVQNRKSRGYLLQEHRVVLKAQAYRNPVSFCLVHRDFCNLSTCTDSLLALKGKEDKQRPRLGGLEVL